MGGGEEKEEEEIWARLSLSPVASSSSSSSALSFVYHLSVVGGKVGIKERKEKGGEKFGGRRVLAVMPRLCLCVWDAETDLRQNVRVSA